jgi:cbb3-type cytochrome oxidase maturation protein
MVMNIIILMIPMALILGFGFLAAFFMAANSEQFVDLDTPAQRMLFDETEERKHKT